MPLLKRHQWPWWPLFALAVLAVGATDLFVLAEVKAFLGSGYNGRALSGAAETLGFLGLGFACDAGFLALLWGAFSLALRPFLAAPRRAAAALGAAAATPVFIDIGLHKLHATLGDVIGLDLVLDLTAGDSRGALDEVLASLPSVGVLLVGTGLCLAALWWGSGWVGARMRMPVGGGRRRVLVGAASVALALLALRAAQGNPTLRFGLGWKPSGMVLSALSTRLTDFDLDGAGAIALPVDAAPFDPGRHPFALDLRGNGIDENGLAGDLPRDFRASQPLPAARVLPVEGSPRVVVLVLLESFRADLLGARVAGQPITPHLNRLAREGVSSAHAYTHSAMTWPARSSLFQGSVAAQPDARTLVDDFRDAGFDVGWFSGQYDSLREGARFLGFERASRFRDARAHLDVRTSRSAQPISLQTSWQTVVADAEAYLDERGETGAPLFLYVNLTDTHFPYDHARLEPILTHDRLPRDRISRENRDAVWRAYANAAANVDRGIGRLRAALEAHFPADEIGILVTADHGEAFYEPRFLGHGQSFERTQAGVPLVAHGLGGTWPEPFALSDVRGLLTAAASSAQRRGHFAADPGRAVFHYAGEVEAPRLLGLRTLAGLTEWNPHEDAPRDDDAFRRLIHTWEAVREARAQPPDARDRPVPAHARRPTHAGIGTKKAPKHDASGPSRTSPTVELLSHRETRQYHRRCEA